MAQIPLDLLRENDRVLTTKHPQDLPRRLLGRHVVSRAVYDIAHPYSALDESWVHRDSDTSLATYCATLVSQALGCLESSRGTAEQLVQDAGYDADSATTLLNYVYLKQRASGDGLKQRRILGISDPPNVESINRLGGVHFVAVPSHHRR
ncbi:Peptidase S28 [Cordyceps militaris]|uniref:Peptidase S28 n=1 Tax=Cordyceps militaris TaxID=73501 RepID=A0A2H4SU23_CORMI|nr:Peptidase S28 [Cordyceps militaris]